MAVMLPKRETSCNELQRIQVEYDNRPHRRPSRIQVVTLTVQLLHSIYTRPTPLVKGVCISYDITVLASGPKIPRLESMINSYLRDVATCLKENSFLTSASKSSVLITEIVICNPMSCAWNNYRELLDGQGILNFEPCLLSWKKKIGYLYIEQIYTYKGWY